MNLYRLRYRLARLIAPVPIMTDPRPGEDGAFAVIREGGTVAMVKFDKARLKTGWRLPEGPPTAGGWATYRPSGRYTRFVGISDS